MVTQMPPQMQGPPMGWVNMLPNPTGNFRPEISPLAPQPAEPHQAGTLAVQFGTNPTT